MENTDNKTSPERKITVSFFITWALGLLMVFAGFSYLFSQPVVALLSFLVAIIVLPPATKYIKEKYNLSLSKGLKIIVVILLLALIGNIRDDISDTSASPQEIASEEQSKNAGSEAISYQIIHTNNGNRYDGGTEYYVLIDPILIQEAFKDDIGGIIKEIVSENGSKLSINIFDNRNALEVMYKQYGDRSLGRIRTTEENSLVERHYIASFDGELATNLYTNTLTFFPAAFTSSVEVGNYVESLEFNP